MELTTADIREVKQILLKYYPDKNRYVTSIDKILQIEDLNSFEFAAQVGQIGWSGMGSFLDQVFCDCGLDYEAMTSETFLREVKKFEVLLTKLGDHALKCYPEVPNHEAISSMLSIWKSKHG